MTQRLYKVMVERIFEVVVIASDEDEAESVAFNAVEENDGGLGHEQLVTNARPLTHVKQLPSGWDQDSLPYGKDEQGERKINAILSIVQP